MQRLGIDQCNARICQPEGGIGPSQNEATAMSRADFLRGGRRSRDSTQVPATAPSASLPADSPVASVPVIATVTSACLAAAGVQCRTCEDPCDAGAIRFRPMPGGRTVPTIGVAVCTGCGACLSACPVGALRLQARPAMQRASVAEAPI